MKTSEKIKKLRIEKGLSQEALGELVGVKKAAINKYETGRVVNIKKSMLQQLAEALDVRPADLLDDIEDLSGDFSEVISNHARSIPIMGTICAGTGVVCEDAAKPRFIIDAEVDADFALRVQGDSMKDAEIYDKDIIFIKRNVELINNYIYAVELLLTNEAVLRRVSLVNGSFVLTPCNPDYDPLIADPDDVRIIGRCMGVYHSL